MALFHRRRPYTEILNNLVLAALKERSQYPVCREYFGLKEIDSRRVNADDISSDAVRLVRDELRERGHKLKEETGKRCYIEVEREGEKVYVVRLSLGVPQKELEAKGIRRILWGHVYSQIVEKICSEGEVDDLDEVVAAELRLEEIVYKRISEKSYPIEKEKQFDREHIREYAEANGMDPDKVEEVFDFLAAKNQHIQSLGKPCYTEEEKKEKKNGGGGGWQQSK
jgi:hypothetical protein